MMAVSQTGQTNYSVQFGYQFKRLNPQAFNFALDSIANVQTTSARNEFERIVWTPGFAGGIGWHRRRLNVRLHFNEASGTSDFIGLDSLGGEQQREVRIGTWNAGLHLISQLIPFDDYGGIYVGGAFQITQINTFLRQAAAAEELPDFERITNRTKTSFNILLPIRYSPIPQIQLSLEPYFQVFFSPTDFRGFSNTLNGETISTEKRGGLIGELDHFGANLQLIVYLLPK